MNLGSVAPVTGRAPRGFTIVELVLGLSLTALVLSMAYSFQVGATRETKLTGEHAEALRSVLVAMESMRRDLEQMLYQCPQRDLALLPHPELGPGRAISLRVPDPGEATDPWKALHVPVLYELRRVAGSPHAHHLVRKEAESGRETVLRSCLLRDMLAHFIPLKAQASQGLSRYQAYLEITMIGLGSPEGTATYTASMMVPLALMSPAGIYTVRVQ